MMKDFIVCKCIGVDDRAVIGMEFQIIKESSQEVIYTGKTDEEGNIRVPFEYNEEEYNFGFIF